MTVMFDWGVCEVRHVPSADLECALHVVKSQFMLNIIVYLPSIFHKFVCI